MNQSQSFQDMITWIRHCTPYIRAHRGRTFVISIPGEVVSWEGFSQLMQDIALLHSIGVRLVLCHGAKPQIAELLQQAGIHSVTHLNRRVTDEKTLALVEQAAYKVRARLEAQLSLGMGLKSGGTVRVISGNFVTAQPLGVLDGLDHQFTGKIRKIDHQGIREQLDNGIVLLSCLGYSPTGEIFNIAAEEVAAITAEVLKADKAIYLLATDPPLQRGDLTLEAARAKMRQAKDELKHCLELGLHICKHSVKRVHFLNLYEDGSLLLELLTRDGCGLMISSDIYESMRGADFNDIAGILEIIEPLEQQGVLIKRPRQQLELEIDKFHVLDRDGMIIGCAALFPFKDIAMAELAALAVHPDYNNTGKGAVILSQMEKKARAQGIASIFVLTTQTAHWFLQNGFEEKTVDDLPVQRRALYNYNRNSKVFLKKLS